MVASRGGQGHGYRGADRICRCLCGGHGVAWAGSRVGGGAGAGAGAGGRAGLRRRVRGRGDLIWFTIAATGLAALAQTFAALFVAIKYIGAAYLLYLAWRLWMAPAAPVEASAATVRGERGVRLFLAELAITLGNPKVIVFFLALLPTVVDLEARTPAGFAEIAALSAAILSAVLGAYVAAVARARRLFTSPGAVRLVNRGTGAAMAGAAVAVATR